ncbi:hypothetical protein Q5P01_005970 [Channa striata]|uniref:Ig-like domain-containing protein n=1 Tax=Channa striata TaxID=64152 RepID=A0AA88NQ81_CHASR|nr:hypothetical protein Q5P01_005970 [Channa striata]
MIITKTCRQTRLRLSEVQFRDTDMFTDTVTDWDMFHRGAQSPAAALLSICADFLICDPCDILSHRFREKRSVWTVWRTRQRDRPSLNLTDTDSAVTPRGAGRRRVETSGFVERLRVICIFTLLTLFAVNSNGQATGDIGGDVLLSCVYREEDLPNKVSAFWRDKDDNVVLDIKNNVPETSWQNPKFRDRVTSFPDLYKAGNFSIVLSNLQKSDSGVYQCDVQPVGFTRKVTLSVSDKYAVKVSTPPTVTTTTAAAVNSNGQATGDIGGDVLLSCVYREEDLPNKVSAFWRDKDDNVTGNFSIVLSNLQKSDSGVYQCDVQPVGFTRKVTLSVSELANAPTVPVPQLTGLTAASVAGPAEILSVSAPRRASASLQAYSKMLGPVFKFEKDFPQLAMDTKACPECYFEVEITFNTWEEVRRKMPCYHFTLRHEQCMFGQKDATDVKD